MKKSMLGPMWINPKSGHEISNLIMQNCNLCWTIDPIFVLNKNKQVIVNDLKVHHLNILKLFFEDKISCFGLISYKSHNQS